MRLLVPDQVLGSVLDIDFEYLKEKNLLGLLVDIDNTLVRWEKSSIDPKFVQWVGEAKDEGFRVCLVSNALEKRVQFFAELLHIPAVARAWKPSQRAFLRGIHKLEMDKEQIAVVGDQLFTDVFGGNRLGLYTILINPLSSQELKTTKFMRKLEKRMIERMVRQGFLDPTAIQIRNGEE
ncbi:MAG: YqeG family HAD IIIA-type phosphatase [Firmicutes bacterium]|nr:YqeG family HAD IIIA-type phosphatase [Bacillota bacterium]